MRTDGRKNDQLRPLKVTRNFIKHAEGSVLIEIGDTKVICTATIEDKVPPFLKEQNVESGSKKGWITAEYAMLPRAAYSRIVRESSRGRVGGRTHEIQRLIGRSLRAVVDLEVLGERTIWIDCDVIQADGGTRTASVTGAFIALVDAMKYAGDTGLIEEIPVKNFLAAISVGKVHGNIVLDLNYAEDSIAEVDMNLVMTDDERLVEVQGTAEGVPFTKKELDIFYELAKKGISELIERERELLGDII